MNVNPNELRRVTVQVLNRVNEEMTKYEIEAAQSDDSPFQIKDANGNAQYMSLVVSKVSLLNTLTLLNEQGKKR